MPMLNCYVSDDDMKQLEHCSKILGRTVEDLAESAISETAWQSKQDLGEPDTDDKPCPEYGGDIIHN